MVAQKSGQHILVGPSWLHEQAAAVLRCKRLLELLKVAERPSRSPALASRCSCPSPERIESRSPPSSSARHATAAHTTAARRRPFDARVGSLHPRDERSSHLEFGWSRPHGANRRCHTPRLEQATNSWRNSACGLYVWYEQSGQPRSEGFENVRAPWRFGPI